jgi:hypothetical protein
MSEPLNIFGKDDPVTCRMETIQGNCEMWKEDASYGQPVLYQGDSQCTKVQVRLLYPLQLWWGDAIWPKEW